METYRLYFGMLMLVMANTLLGFVAVTASGAGHLKSDGLCSQCSKCDTSSQCPASEAYPHMTGYDDSLIASALQSDYVSSKDTGIYSVPNIKGGESDKYNAYYRGNLLLVQLPAITGGQSYLTVDKNGKVSLRSLSSLENLAETDWKSINPPKNLNHQEFRFWVSNSSGKCLTVFGGKKEKRTVGVAD
ncbi:hypothetical protein LOK49_LG08G01926 [Camellia lanceoleosa]|uniref:Uncharacterized protein n=1 Tax=Camellia lanceoleosa TaxID=1840588 RepID=A0ACC0GRV7_9ERIC|nr:hypothetical protein LOK49_LG08G01926 [Camellia lanceoleosa]